MIIIVGLGNPGQKFQKTRHNLGFWVVDKIAANFQFSIFNFQSKLNAQISEGKINKEKIILAKPQTFVNNSGKAVKSLIENFKLKIENLYVIHDDADLPIGTLRIVKNRGAGGHKGVESIMRALKTRDFVRFRIGTKPSQSGKIPHRPPKEMAKFLVEKKIPVSQEKILKKVIRKCLEAVEMTMKEGLEKAMNIFNRNFNRNL